MTAKIKIKVQGQLDETWRDWFDGLDFIYEGKNTMLTGKIEDEAHVHGILNRIRDLNLKLISVSINADFNNETNNNKSN